MNHSDIRDCFIVFNFLFTLIWILCYTFHPIKIMNSDDFIAPGRANRGDNNAINNGDSTFSVPGRSFIFLFSILISLVISILFYLYLRYIDNHPKIQCVKGEKNIKNCKIVS